MAGAEGGEREVRSGRCESCNWNATVAGVLKRNGFAVKLGRLATASRVRAAEI